MKNLIIGFTLALSTTMTAVADEGCSPIGSWYGYYAPTETDPANTPKWLATNNGALSSDRRTISAMIGGINAEEVRWATVLITGTG